MFITCLGSQFEENAFLFCTAADSSIKGCYKLVATLMSNYYCAMQKTKQWAFKQKKLLQSTFTSDCYAAHLSQYKYFLLLHVKGMVNCLGALFLNKQMP